MDQEVRKKWSKQVDEATKEPLAQDYAKEVERESIRLLLLHGIPPGTIKSEAGRTAVHRLNQAKIQATIAAAGMLKAGK